MNNTILKVGDKVCVKSNLEIAQDGEEIFWNEKATIVDIDNFLFPISIRFDNLTIQELFQSMGERRYESFELELIK